MGQESSPVPFLERHEIESKAAVLVQAISQGRFRLNAFDIANYLKISFVFVKFEQPDIAGMLVQEEGRVEIRVNSDDPLERQNFTVAHELGHLTLSHPGTWKDTTNTMYRRSAWSADASGRRAEYQANLFAASLLMPEPLVRERWHILRSINYLAPELRVSKRAMYRRLEELGLIVPTPKEIRFLDLSGWDSPSEIPALPTLADHLGPIPRFPPIATDELGRIIPMSDEDWTARSSAFSRALKIAGNRIDYAPRAENGEPGEREK